MIVVTPKLLTSAYEEEEKVIQAERRIEQFYKRRLPPSHPVRNHDRTSLPDFDENTQGPSEPSLLENLLPELLNMV